MAHFVEQYTDMLRACDDYDALAGAIDVCISKNILNSVSSDIKKAIDDLGLNTPFYKFIKIMVWASTVSDHTETSLELLRYFCNKIVKEFDNLTMELDEFSLMIVTICADDKQFINKLSDDRKIELYNTISKWYLCHNKDDINDEYLKGLIVTSIDLILNGKISMQELDWEFRKFYNDIKAEDVGTYRAHKVNEIIRPFQAIFMNIVQNVDQRTLLNEINVDEWRRRVDERIQSKASMYEKKLNSKNSYDDYYLLLNDLMFTFKSLNDELSNTGYTNIANPIVGKFIWIILGILHHNYTQMDFSTKEIVIIFRDVQQIFFNSFAVNENARTIINMVVSSYCDSGEYEDSLIKGEYLEAIKAYLNQDEMFKLWVEDTKTNRAGYLDRVYATYIHCYMNPVLDSVDKLISTQEEIPEVSIDPKPDVCAATEAKSEQLSMEDDDNTEDEDDEKYDGPEIEAKQSNKGYKKGSKVQADSERKIYSAYKKYKNNEAKVDSQLSKMLGAAKRAFSQDKTEEIIEGKKFTPIGLLKKILITSAIFNYSKVAGFAYLLVSHTISKKRTAKQKREILLQIETELKMLDEKIEDARGDGNRKAKYALMRTKAELERARDKIKYNLTATKDDMKTAKAYIDNDSRDNL